MNKRCKKMGRIFLGAVLALNFIPGILSAAESYPFFGKAKDLNPKEAWYIDHDHAAGIQGLGYDIKAVRWNETTQAWTRVHNESWSDYAADPQNEDWVIYDKPVYAIADGEVLRCWRNAPENPAPGETHWARLTDPPMIGGGGNGLWVLQDDGAVALYAHFRPGTVPASLCPNDQIYVESETDSVLPEANRPRVRAGDLVGRVGNSGASTNPHLHIHLQNILPEISGGSGNALPLDFHNIWVQATDDGQSWEETQEDWAALTGDRITDPPTAVYPSPFLRRGDAKAGRIYEVAMEGVSGVGSVTAVQDSDGNLKLITWGVNGTGKVERKFDAQAGYATRIQMVHPGLTRDVVTAVRDGGGNLKLIGWGITEAGGIHREGEAQAGPVSRIAMVPTPTGPTGVITAVRESQGNLKLISWEVNSTQETIERIDDASAGAISEVAMAKIVDGRLSSEEGTVADRFTGVVTAVRDADGKLKLIAWEVTPDMQLIRRGEASAGEIHDVKITSVRINNLREMLVTSVKQSDGRLKMIAWEVGSEGQIVRKGDALAGGVYGMALSSFGNHNVVSSVRTGEGKLRLINWYVNPDGTLERDGENDAGTVYHMAITGRRIIDGRNYLLGAFQDGDINLKTIAWEVNVRP